MYRCRFHPRKQAYLEPTEQGRQADMQAGRHAGRQAGLTGMQAGLAGRLA